MTTKERTVKQLDSNLLKEIKPLYVDLIGELDKVSEPLYPFFMQWGENFEYNDHNGILFVGKSVNGWTTSTRDIDVLFDIENENRIFARDGQLKWVDAMRGDEIVYNTNSSSFWRVIMNTSIEFYKDENWFNNVAWSNLYKISPEKGNPNKKIQDLQRTTCIKILTKEIELIKPKFVVFLTSGWEDKFLQEMDIDCDNCELMKWDKYETRYIKKNGIVYIFSKHPQGKPEDEHKNVLLNIMNSL